MEGFTVTWRRFNHLRRRAEIIDPIPHGIADQRRTKSQSNKANHYDLYAPFLRKLFILTLKLRENRRHQWATCFSFKHEIGI